MNLQQYLHENGLQREDLLTRIAVSLELDETRKQRMDSAYNAVYDILEKDEVFFSKVDFLVYPQGSKAIGTTVKPRGKEEFDLDITVEIRDLYYNYTSSEIYNHLIRVLSASDVYKEKLVKKNRCARINYVGDFHMDILPGCIVINGDSKIMVPDRELSSWSSSNPKGYSNWFIQKAETVDNSYLNKAFRSFSALNEVKAEQEEIPDDDVYSKEPLKRAVQLTKRFRDIYFEKNPKYKTSSIVLTTIFGEFYEGEPSIYQTIDSILDKIVQRYSDYQYLFESKGVYKRIKVLNPVNSDEDFTEKWDKEKEYYTQFIRFAKSYKEKWEKLKNGDFGVAEELFGSDRIKGILTAQLKEMAKNGGNQLEAAGVTIMSGNTFVDRSGNVSNSGGYRSKENRNFGGVE
ncbi:nucleotidyltransferase [Arenibacter sp. F26102]|uniref:nucleotidyltransferase domain-containing protein n=1 Tax=Arenibacter sp. F26102 TaxID=2926416 RepID=UPI001FF50079|nr:nucleotidyltransferase [Arenibacter sp. F26102]MCK0145823.1 nucleotidyltransferase [Arenibacter sp. F26102]